MNNNQKPVKTPLDTYQSARSNLLLVVVFTAVNLVLSLVSADVYLLFSATVPQLILAIGQVFENSVALAVCAVLAFLGVGVYLLCWALCKKHRGWMVVALVLFSLDTLAALAMLLADTSMILDVAIHAWVLYYLITGTAAMVKMKKNPELAIEPAPETSAEVVAPVENAVPSSPAAFEPIAPAVLTQAPAPVVVNGEPVDE